MNNPDSRPVLVTGEERANPAVRLLARACIALAQERLAEQKQEVVEAAECASKSEGAVGAERKKEVTDATDGAVRVAEATNTPKPALKAESKETTPKPTVDRYQEEEHHA